MAFWQFELRYAEGWEGKIHERVRIELDSVIAKESVINYINYKSNIN